jgi:hypothetical protein
MDCLDDNHPASENTGGIGHDSASPGSLLKGAKASSDLNRAIALSTCRTSIFIYIDSTSVYKVGTSQSLQSITYTAHNSHLVAGSYATAYNPLNLRTQQPERHYHRSHTKSPPPYNLTLSITTPPDAHSRSQTSNGSCIISDPIR